MSHQAVERAAALIVRCQPTLRALALRAPPSLRCCQPKLPALAAADPGENSGADRRDPTKCDELCQELMALPDSALEACLPQTW